ncbi:SRPBCC domain-containing protein [Lentibacillus sediminis]|uniref:SRPBCC domain-containing protein n=1 Tax=Lentibacillus sediminis TaxID=1940529 RepID=UPI000C1C10BB|nr:SRPBCC domain-containing protein [Lentibacillus sediminis]
MSQSLIVRDEIFIQSRPDHVWRVLVKPEYVNQWDELPEDYPEEDMTVGSEVAWDLPNGEVSKTTVTKADEGRELQISLYVSTWDVTPAPEDIAYTYKLQQEEAGTRLTIEIGDFSILPDGEKYYEASVEFAAEAKEKIKRLAEYG